MDTQAIHKCINGQSPSGLARHENLHQYPDMDYLVSNLKHLIARSEVESESQFAQEAGGNQSTLNRIMRGEIQAPRDSTIRPYANYFGISLNDLRYADLTIASSATGSPVLSGTPNRSTCHIGIHDSFPMPVGTRAGAIVPGPSIEVAKAWLAQHTTAEPREIRYAVARDDALEGKIERGDIVFLDTRVERVEQDGIYAFTYFGTPMIRYGQIVGKDSLRFTGTRTYANSVPVEGKELEGLEIAGLVFAAWGFRTF